MQGACPQYGKTVGQGHGLGLIVGDIEGGDFQGPLQTGDLHADLETQIGIQVGEWFVHEKHCRLAHQRPPHGDPLALATGQCLRTLLQQVRQPQQRGNLLDPLAALALRHLAHAQRKGHVLADGHMGIEGVILEHHGHVALLRFQAVDAAAIEENVTAGDFFQSRQQAQQGGLATTRRAGQHQQLTLPDLQIEVMQGMAAIAIDLVDLAEFNSAHCLIPVAAMP